MIMTLAPVINFKMPAIIGILKFTTKTNDIVCSFVCILNCMKMRVEHENGSSVPCIQGVKKNDNTLNMQNHLY